jgi:fructuronate reductase
MSDGACREWVEQWWDEACAHLALPATDYADYRAALVPRFANTAIEHRLDQIAKDGSLKLPVRILPTVRAERAEGHLPVGACRALAAWVLSLRAAAGPASDPRADELVELARGPLRLVVPRTLGAFDLSLPDDAELVAVVLELAFELERP